MWDEVFDDINMFNQINCALYEDSCTWFVAGSHLRRDLPREAKLFPDRPIAGLDLKDKTVEERERVCLEYCRSMPGSVQLHLEAGDFALYRNTLWHLGNYVPYKKRATLHDSATTPEFDEWSRKASEAAQKQREAGNGMENPNEKSAGAQF
jgi:ectoine hydroxylase-related dioxygenase (phytanoyl-CoA dioxygenase family)